MPIFLKRMPSKNGVLGNGCPRMPLEGKNGCPVFSWPIKDGSLRLKWGAFAFAFRSMSLCCVYAHLKRRTFRPKSARQASGVPYQQLQPGTDQVHHARIGFQFLRDVLVCLQMLATLLREFWGLLSRTVIKSTGIPGITLQDGNQIHGNSGDYSPGR